MKQKLLVEFENKNFNEQSCMRQQDEDLLRAGYKLKLLLDFEIFHHFFQEIFYSQKCLFSTFAKCSL
jgi:hypothetical protein